MKNNQFFHLPMVVFVILILTYLPYAQVAEVIIQAYKAYNALQDKAAKGKASEIRQAFAAWSKLQAAYSLEVSKVGDCKAISFIPPGTDKAGNSSKTTHFSYECGIRKECDVKGKDGSIAFLYAKSLVKIADCPAGTVFKIENTVKNAGDLDISVSPLILGCLPIIYPKH